MKFRQIATFLGLAIVPTMWAHTASADNVKIGSLGAITGPIVSLVAEINKAERAAIAEINKAGGILGKKVALVEVDTACNPQTAVDAANKLINIERVSIIVGALCSGASISAHSNVAKNSNVAMISPASTSPAITTLSDNDLFFRVVPSDAFQGKMLAKLVLSKGTKKVALTWINNDYGKGFADAFKASYIAGGGKITNSSGHEEGKASYRSELATLAKGGADTLVLLAYGDGSGVTMMKQALEGGLFKTFVGGDGMKSDKLVSTLGAKNLKGHFYGTIATGKSSSEADKFKAMYGGGKSFKFNSPYTNNAYDAIMISALAIAAAGKTDRAAVAKAVRKVASAPGAQVGPGDMAKALKLINQGKDINYQGASGPHDFDKNGDVPGVIAEWQISGNGYKVSDPMK